MAVNKTKQRQILQAAQDRGELDQLFWYMVRTDTKDDQAVTVNHVLLVLPVAPDPEETRHYAHLMLDLAKVQSGIEALALDITSKDLITQSNLEWIIYGEHDEICPYCGGINDSCVCGNGGTL